MRHVDLGQFSGFARLRVYNVILKVAARKARKAEVPKVEKELPNSVFVLTAIARAVWAGNRRTAAELTNSRPEARTFLEITQGKVMMKSAVHFNGLAVVAKKAGDERNESENEKHKFWQKHSGTVLHRLGRLWSLFRKRLTLAGVRVGETEG